MSQDLHPNEDAVTLDKEAAELISDYANGSTRLIGIICERALQAATEVNSSEVTVPIVTQVAESMGLTRSLDPVGGADAEDKFSAALATLRTAAPTPRTTNHRPQQWDDEQTVVLDDLPEDDYDADAYVTPEPAPQRSRGRGLLWLAAVLLLVLVAGSGYLAFSKDGREAIANILPFGFGGSEPEESASTQAGRLIIKSGDTASTSDDAARLRAQLREIKDDRDSLALEVSALREVNQRLQSALNSSASSAESPKIAALQAELTQLEEERTFLVDQLAALKRKSESGSAGAGDQELNKLRADNDLLTSERAALQEQVAELEKELTLGQGGTSSGDVAALQKQVADVTAARKSLAIRVSQLQRDNQELRRDLLQAQASAQSAREELESRLAELATIRIERDEINSELTDTQGELSNREQVQNDRVTELLSRAGRQVLSDRLLAPAGDNALDSYRQVLLINPQEQRAVRGIQRIKNIYWQRAEEAKQAKRFQQARGFYAALLSIDPTDEATQRAKRQVERRLLTDRQTGGLDAIR